MIKIDIISGFLGAGKTTLIQKLFPAFKDEQIVLIENEFGEIGIDGSFLKGSGVQIKEINAGCICCSLVGDFTTSIKEVIATYHPDRIIIEPSGVGKLSDIINAIKKTEIEELKLNILATVVDGPKTKSYLKNFGEFFLNQVESADTIIVSKTDKMSEDKIDDVVALIKGKNSHANVITTPVSSFSSEKLLSLLEEKASLEHALLKEVEEEHEHEHECSCHGEHHHHDDEHEHHHHDDEHDCCCHHDEEEHEHHHHDDEHECCCHDEEHEHHHHDDEHECCCHHDEEEHEHHHHDHDHECCCHDEDEHEHHHHDDEHECCCHHDEEGHHHHHHHGHDADEVFQSWGKETAKSVSKEELETFLSTLSNDESLGIVVRSKGILKANDSDKWYYFDFVSGDYEIRLGEPDYTGRIVVIGSKLDEEKISSLFFGK